MHRTTTEISDDSLLSLSSVLRQKIDNMRSNRGQTFVCSQIQQKSLIIIRKVFDYPEIYITTYTLADNKLEELFIFLKSHMRSGPKLFSATLLKYHFNAKYVNGLLDERPWPDFWKFNQRTVLWTFYTSLESLLSLLLGTDIRLAWNKSRFLQNELK